MYVGAPHYSLMDCGNDSQYFHSKADPSDRLLTAITSGPKAGPLQRYEITMRRDSRSRIDVGDVMMTVSVKTRRLIKARHIQETGFTERLESKQ